jgi:hypothetical protein
MSTTPARTIYQLEVVPLGISPLIWRRLVRSDSTMADLHPMRQIAMGWRDTRLKGSALTGFVSFTPVRR